LLQEAIDSIQIKQLIASGTTSLYNHKAEVDALNVFPVPDGDTGTNMYLTFQSALRELNNNQSLRVIDLLESAAYGALMGARGNSGVIVSQFFRGFVKALPKDLEKLTKYELALGIQGAYTLSYQAVRQPVEGTILTVIREMAKFAEENVVRDIPLSQFMMEIYQHARKILARTPEMLPVLKQAGVVDAGGQGLVWFTEGIARQMNGESFPEFPQEVLSTSDHVKSVSSYTANELLPDSEINFQYCTEFILKGKELDLEHIKNSLSPHGDCLLVVGDENTVKIHIHTNNPGLILDFAVRFGEMFEIQIHNMIEQSQQRLAKQIAEQGNGRIGIIAVAAGDGLEKIFRSLGVQGIVNGGQTMNPSIEDLAKAVSSLNASEVIILPNNSNIVMTASHVQDLVNNKKVRVVPTQSIPEGLAAMLSFSDDKSLDENVESMTEKGRSLITGEVTYAVRNTTIANLEIRQGDTIGLVNGNVVFSGNTPEEVVAATLKQIPNSNSGLISIYYGAEVTAATAQNLLNHLEESYPQAEIELYYGGQPLYYYFFSVE
jgi:DAK2 domain fusion protein YloV